jgi:hypothetical protein
LTIPSPLVAAHFPSLRCRERRIEILSATSLFRDRSNGRSRLNLVREIHIPFWILKGTPMPSERAQKTNTIREYLDGSLAPEQMSEAERLIEHDPDVRTVLDHPDKLETFVCRLQEALAMPLFPAEQDDQKSDALCRALAPQIQAPSAEDDTAALNSNDPSVSTAPQTPAPPQPDGFAFLSPPQAADEIGRLNGYRVLRLLGQGGMGVVFEAEDVRLKRRVALKVMKPEIAAKEEHRVRFLREAQTAAAVEHDFICPIYQVGEENGTPFIAMPFLKGEPLDERLKRERPLPLPEAIRIGAEVAEGLAEAHKAGLVHRDIKPGNIWLETLPNGRSRSWARRPTWRRNRRGPGRSIIAPISLAWASCFMR